MYLHWKLYVSSTFLTYVDLTLPLSREAGTSFSEEDIKRLAKCYCREALERCQSGRTSEPAPGCFNQWGKISGYHLTSQLFSFVSSNRNGACLPHPPTKNLLHRTMEATRKGVRNSVVWTTECLKDVIYWKNDPAGKVNCIIHFFLLSLVHSLILVLNM